MTGFGVLAGEEAESGGGLSQGLLAHVPSGLSRGGSRIVKLWVFRRGPEALRGSCSPESSENRVTEQENQREVLEFLALR